MSVNTYNKDTQTLDPIAGRAANTYTKVEVDAKIDDINENLDIEIRNKKWKSVGLLKANEYKIINENFDEILIVLYDDTFKTSRGSGVFPYEFLKENGYAEIDNYIEGRIWIILSWHDVSRSFSLTSTNGLYVDSIKLYYR